MGMDRLSNLPEPIIGRILSLMDAREAVQTSILSKKWKFQWAHAPSYTFNNSSSEEFVANLLNNRKLHNLSRPSFGVNGSTLLPLIRNVFCPYVICCQKEELDDRRKIVETNGHMLVDRISSLPNNLIEHIMRLMDIKSVLQTSILSKRWSNMWTSVHSVNFHRSSFRTQAEFKIFGNKVLERCRSFQKLKLICGDKRGMVKFAETILTDSKLEWVEELETDMLGEIHRSYANRTDWPPGECYFNHVLLLHQLIAFENLSTLKLSSTTVPDSIGTMFESPLEHLILENCVLKGVSGGTSFSIYAPKLVRLTVSYFQGC